MECGTEYIQLKVGSIGFILKINIFIMEGLVSFYYNIN